MAAQCHLESRGPVPSAISSPLTSADDLRTVASSLPYLNICYRGFAKSKKSKDDSGDMAIDIGLGLKKGAEAQMDAAVIALSRDLAKLTTGRASARMLDHIIVEVDGVKMPLIKLAVVSVLDPKTLWVNPYDPNTLKTLASAIVSSPLGLDPKVDGQHLSAAIPPGIPQDRDIKKSPFTEVVAKSCEDVKYSIRRACQKALDTIKKASSGLSKDLAKKLEREVSVAEDMCRAKEKKITSG